MAGGVRGHVCLCMLLPRDRGRPAARPGPLAGCHGGQQPAPHAKARGPLTAPHPAAHGPAPELPGKRRGASTGGISRAFPENSMSPRLPLAKLPPFGGWSSAGCRGVVRPAPAQPRCAGPFPPLGPPRSPLPPTSDHRGVSQRGPASASRRVVEAGPASRLPRPPIAPRLRPRAGRLLRRQAWGLRAD